MKKGFLCSSKETPKLVAEPKSGSNAQRFIAEDTEKENQRIEKEKSFESNDGKIKNRVNGSNGEGVKPEK
eukprot:764932-Hanusia_phi.AAC.11